MQETLVLVEPAYGHRFGGHRTYHPGGHRRIRLKVLKIDQVLYDFIFIFVKFRKLLFNLCTYHKYTVTVSRAYLDSLLDSVAQARSQRDIAAQATQQVADQLRSEMESRYNTYVTHVGWLIALFALIPGLVVPILINRRFEDEIKNSIKAHDKKIKAQESAMDESNTRIKEATVDIQKVQTAVIAAEKNIQDKIATHDKAIKESNTRITETEESIQKVKTAVEESAQEAKIFALFSQAYYEKDLDNQIALYTQILDIDPSYAEAYYNRGNAYNDKGEYDKAIEDCTQAIKFDPEKASYYDSRADAYMIMENYAKALNDVEEGLKRNPNKTIRKRLEEKQRICQEKLQG